MKGINNVNYSDMIYISKSCISTKLTVILSCIVLDNDEEDVAHDFVIGDQLYSPGFQFSCHLDFFLLQTINKIWSRWDGPFVITNVFSHGVVEIKN